MLKGRPVSDLLRDYLTARDWLERHFRGDRARKSEQESAQYERLAAYHKFVSREAHLLEQFPGELFAILHNQPTNSEVYGADGTLGANPWPNRAWVRRLNPPPTDPNPELVCTFKVGSPVNTVATIQFEGYSHVITGSVDGVARLWRISDHQLVREFKGHETSISTVCILKSNRLITRSIDRVVKMWDVRTGVCVSTPFQLGDIYVCALDGGRVVTQVWGGGITGGVWNADTGKKVGQFHVFAESVHALCGLSNGAVVIVSGNYTANSTTQVHSLLPVSGLTFIGEEVIGASSHTLEGHTSNVKAASVLGRDRVVTGSDDYTARVWDARTGGCLHTLGGHTKPVNAVCALSDDLVVTGSDDRTARVWHARTGECLHTLNGHTGFVRAVCAVGSDRIVTGSDDSTAQVWDMGSRDAHHRTLHEHTGPIHAVCIVGGYVVTGSDDHTAMVWDARTGECLHTLSGHTKPVNAVCALSDDLVVTGSDDRTARVWHARTGECLHTLNGHTGFVRAVCAVGSDRIVTGSDDATARVWDVSTGAYMHTLPGHTGAVSAVFPLDGDRVATGSWDHTVRVWNVNGGECVRTLTGHTGRIHALCAVSFSVVTGLNDRTVRVWDVGSGTCLRTLKGHTHVVSALCALGGGRVGSGSHDATVRVWDVDSGERLCVYPWHAPITALTTDPTRPGLIVAGDTLGRLLFLQFERPPNGQRRLVRRHG